MKRFCIILLLLTAAFLGGCTASMSLFWKNQNSSQSTEQATQARMDTLKIPDVNINL